MILVDTNIIIDFWKNPSIMAHKIFEREEIAICGVIQVELIHGAKSEKDIDVIIDSLEELIFFDVEKDDWLEIGKILNRLKKKGISVPFQDAVIAFLAIKNKVELWTNDKHFSLIQSEIEELKIFRFEKMEQIL